MTVYPLKKKYVPVIEVDCLTYSGWESAGLGLDRYIAQCYNLSKRFEIIPTGNDTQHRFEVKPLQPSDSDYESEYSDSEEAISNGHCEVWSLGTLLNRMCLDGYLQPGIYVMGVSW